jgi:hypothetical protein
MKAQLTAVLVAMGFVLASVPAIAHHPFAGEYDAAKTVHLTGTVSKLDWANPHAFVHLDAKDDKGQMTKWTVELGGPNALKRRGWTSKSVKTGDQVTVVGWQAKDGGYRVNASTVTRSDGKELDAASSFSNATAKKTKSSH